MSINTTTLYTSRKQEFETLHKIILNSCYEELDIEEYSSKLWIHHYYSKGKECLFNIYVYESRLYGYEE